MSRISAVKHELKLKNCECIIKEYQASELSVKDWCKAQGISRDTYYYWLRKIRERAIEKLPEEIKADLPEETKAPVVFKKLELEKIDSREIPAMPMQVQGVTASAEPEIIVRFAGAELELKGEVNKENLAAVLSTLKKLC